MPPLELGVVEGVQWAGQVDVQVQRDVDDHRDTGPQADGGQAVFEPGRALAVFHAADQTAGELRAFVSFVVRPERHLHDLARADEPPWHRRVVALLNLPKPGGGQVAGDAAHAQGVDAIGGQVDFDDRIDGLEDRCGHRHTDHGIRPAVR